MVDENGLELSLGLSCGRSLSKSKVSDANSDPRLDEGNATEFVGSNLTVSDDSFKKFFNSDLENRDPKGKQKSDPIQYKQENFFTDLSKCSSPITICSNDARSKPQFTKYQELWASNNRTPEAEDEKSSSNKRKLPFEEINFSSKHEKHIDYADKHGKNFTKTPFIRSSHLSIAMEDGSPCDYEGGAEFDADGPKFWLDLQRKEREKCSESLNFNGKNAFNESNGVGSQFQKEPCLLGNEHITNSGKVAFGVPLLLEPPPVMTASYPVSVPSTSSGQNAASLPSTRAMQLMPIANGTVVPANVNNLHHGFNYPSIQLPALQKVSSSAFNSHSVNASFVSRKHFSGAPNQENFKDGIKTSEGTAHNATATGALSNDRKSSDLNMGMAKYAGESGESAQSDGNKLRNSNRTTNEAANKPVMDGFSHKRPDIKPGIAPYLEFGGCGSYPDLPWVSTTGQGPNGKTISGVTYNCSPTEVKVVCACHGVHMTQEEFVQHANNDGYNSQVNSNLATFPSNNTTR